MENSELMIILVALVVLAIIIFVIGHILSQRIKVLEGRIRELADQNNKLQLQLEAMNGVNDSEDTSDLADTLEPIKNPPMSLGERKPAVMANKEMAIVAKAEKPAPIVEDGIDPEVVAVIMAAITACGYTPAAIRAIHRKKPIRATNWVVAARLAGMK